MKLRVASFLILFIFSVGALTGCMTYTAATGRHDFILFPTDVEVMMGQIMHLQIAASQKISRNAAHQNRVNKIGYRIAQVSDRQDYRHQFFVIDADTLNAFTIPGGYVYIYKGLLDKLNDEELAAVLAHEIAHGAARHTIKKFQAIIGYNMLAGAVITRIEDDLKKKIAAIGANGIMSLALAKYGKEEELEADALGVKYAYLAGYEPEAMVQTFQLLDKEGGKDNTPEYLRTHPKFDKRIESVEIAIEQVKNKY